MPVRSSMLAASRTLSRLVSARRKPPRLGVTVQGPECPGTLGVAALGLASAVVAVHPWSVQFGAPWRAEFEPSYAGQSGPARSLGRLRGPPRLSGLLAVSCHDTSILRTSHRVNMSPRVTAGWSVDAGEIAPGEGRERRAWHVVRLGRSFWRPQA